MKMKFLKELLFLFVLFSTSIIVGQTVTGTVTGDGLPLPGVNVQVKNTTKGTTTDFDGKYTISDIGNDAVLIFNSIGFLTKEIVVAGKTKIDVVLEEDVQSLETVVVTGYSSQSTRDITGSVSVIKAKDLEANAPITVEGALQGQASGVTVGAQGGPGGQAVVRIRGFGSTNGNDPLYIIDGTPSSAGLNDLNPNDIASVQVLKDASSSAIYGFRAANGVIVITTKSGSQSGKVKFNANAYTGLDFIPNSVFPDIATPQQQADAGVNSLQFPSGTLPNFLRPIASDTPGTEPYSLENNRITRANQEGTDWFDEYFNAAITTNVSLNVSGGGENSKFFMSLSALDQEGVALETGFERYTLRANSSFNVTNKFRIGENVSLSYSDQILPPGTDVNNGAIGSLFRIHPIIPVRDEGGNFAGVGVTGLGNANNPIAIATRNRDDNVVRIRALGNFYGEYDIIKNLTYKSNLGFDLSTSNTRDFTPQAFEGETERTETSLLERNSLFSSFTWFNTLNYKANLTDDIKLEALVGTEFNESNFKETEITRLGFERASAVPVRTIDNGVGAFGGSGFDDNTRYFSTFGKADVKIKDKYLLSATIRRDATSKFNEDQRVGYFPSASLGWRVSNESFLENSDIFSNLLIKAGYGVVGNDGDINSSARALTVSSDPALFNNGSAIGLGITNGVRGNPDLTWEITKTFNIGFSTKILDAFTFDFDYYSATTEDAIVPVPEDPSIVGENSRILRNLGEISNVGFDATLGYGNDNSDSEFKYNVGFNISAYKNNVEFLDPENPTRPLLGDQLIGNRTINRTEAGQPIGSFYGRVYEGFNADGTARFANNGEEQFIGSPHPDFTYGLNFNANYKAFDFSMFWQGSQGNDLYNFPRLFLDTNSFPGAKSVDFVNQNGVPGVIGQADVEQVSSLFVEDGSYLRLKNIVVGYTLPRSVINKIGVDKVRIYLQGRNLLTFTKYTGLDPEVNLRNRDGDERNLTLGLDTGVYPINRSLILGLNVSL